jgi:hypothetical protein
LAGFCSSIAARFRVCGAFDAYACARAAGALLIKAAGSKGIAGKFVDPAEIAQAASAIAGAAWLEA